MERIILGIDPALGVTGFSIARSQGQKIILLDCGYLSLSATKPLQERISIFYDFFLKKCTENNISEIALETPFLGKNAQSFLKLGYLRGILYLLAHKNNLTLHEFSPREVKQTITGFGGAQKEQVARVVGQLFPRLEQQSKLDVTDAIAIMLCGAWKRSYTI